MTYKSISTCIKHKQKIEKNRWYQLAHRKAQEDEHDVKPEENRLRYHEKMGHY